MENKNQVENIYTLDGKISFGSAFCFGLQHILTMFIPNIAPIALIASVAKYNGIAFTNIDTALLIQNSMLIAGIATLIQCFPLFKIIGAGLPIVMGVSFTFVAPMMLYAQSDYGIAVGAIIVGGIIEGLLGLTAKYWKKFIPPMVSGCLVTAIGYSLFSIGINSLAGGQNALNLANDDPMRFGSGFNLLVGAITLVVALICQYNMKGFLKTLSILFGLIVGYLCALIITIIGLCPMIDFNKITETIRTLGVFSIPRVLYYTPKFELGPIINVSLVFLLSGATEIFGDTMALTNTGLKREATEKEVSGGLLVGGFFSAISAGIFGVSPITTFAQNVGNIALTKVVNKYSVVVTAILLILAGLFPPLGAFFSSIPECVLGGCTVVMFGFLTINGMKMMFDAGIDQRNSIIAATALAFGIGITIVDVSFFNSLPTVVKDIFQSSPVAGVFVISMFLNLILPKEEQ